MSVVGNYSTMIKLSKIKIYDKNNKLIYVKRNFFIVLFFIITHTNQFIYITFGLFAVKLTVEETKHSAKL